ncbi:AI-2E family transporter [bacterium SCSIO 12643]|nr:AI-2E family transporter [bacterium SCSIO 12643]
MQITKKKIFHAILVVIGLGLLWYSSAVLVYLVISLVLALMLSPINQFLRKGKIKGYGINRTGAAIITMSMLIIFLVLIINIFVPVISREVSLLSQTQMDEFYELIEPEVKMVSGALKKIDFDPTDGVKSEKEVLRSLILGKKNVDRVPQFFSGLASGIGGSLVTMFSVMFITFFLLKDDNLFNNFVYSLSSDKNLSSVKNVLEKVKKTLSRYFIGIAIQISVITTFVSIGLTLFGFKNALVIGLFAGIMNVIPYIGPIIGLGFGLLIGVSTNVDMAFSMSIYSLLGKIFLVFGITQAFDNFVTQPVVFSRSINAHPLEIFLVILFAGNISGIPGMIVAIPFYSVVRIIAKEYYGDSKFIRFMTSSMK